MSEIYQIDALFGYSDSCVRSIRSSNALSLAGCSNAQVNEEERDHAMFTRWRLPVKRERATNKGSLTQWSLMANSCCRLEHDDPQVFYLPQQSSFPTP